MTTHKAWVAAIVTALTTFVAMLQARDELGAMRVVDWLIVVVSAIVAGLTVYSVPNQSRGESG